MTSHPYGLTGLRLSCPMPLAHLSLWDLYWGAFSLPKKKQHGERRHFQLGAILSRERQTATPTEKGPHVICTKVQS